VGVAAAEAKNHDIAWLWRTRDFDRVPHVAVEVPFRAAVKVPIRWIEGDLDVRNDARRFVDLGEHHQAIGAGTLPANVMIGTAQPPSGLLDDHKSPRIGLGHTAVSGVGM
jgi:hypothetical protein